MEVRELLAKAQLQQYAEAFVRESYLKVSLLRRLNAFQVCELAADVGIYKQTISCMFVHFVQLKDLLQQSCD